MKNPGEIILLDSNLFRNTVKIKRIPFKIHLILAIISFNLLFYSNIFATRKISGRIVDKANNPVANVLVKAWDQDCLEDIIVPYLDQSQNCTSSGVRDDNHHCNDKNGMENDLMGSDYTDNNGYYEINYGVEGYGHWDPCFDHQWDTRWRPDIYITVEPLIRGHHTVEGRSAIRMNWRLRDDLVINIPDIGGVPIDFDHMIRDIDINETHQVRTGFDPNLHGFNFPNDTFHVCAAPTCKDENPMGDFFNDILRFKWALCGGMAYTALKRYEDLNCNNYFVQLTSEDKLPSTLKEEIVANQVTTIMSARGPGNMFYGSWYLLWQALPERSDPANPFHSIGHNTKGEWDGYVKPELDKGLPVVLGLIRVKSTMDDLNSVSKHHQVLAVGYDENLYFNEITIYAYDPNHPGGLVEITFNTKLRDSYLNIVDVVPFELNDSGQPLTDEIHGFFGNMKSKYSSWSHGNINCMADIKIDKVNIQNERDANLNNITVEVELSTNVIDRDFPTDVPVSDVVPLLVVRCNLGKEAFQQNQDKNKVNAFFDPATNTHVNKEIITFNFDGIESGDYSLFVYADPSFSNEQKLTDPNINNNIADSSFVICPDIDNDGVCDSIDNCPSIPNTGQENSDGDEFGDVCDLCPDFDSDVNTDMDGDGIGDPCDPDRDGDGINNEEDLCPDEGRSQGLYTFCGGIADSLGCWRCGSINPNKFFQIDLIDRFFRIPCDPLYSIANAINYSININLESQQRRQFISNTGNINRSRSFTFTLVDRTGNTIIQQRTQINDLMQGRNVTLRFTVPRVRSIEVTRNTGPQYFLKIEENVSVIPGARNQVPIKFVIDMTSNR